MKKYYRIAGLLIEMETFGRNAEQAKPYECACEGKPDIVVDAQWAQNKAHFDYLSDDDGEYIFAGSSFYRQLLNFGGMLLHSSCVVKDGYAYLFTASPGTGKSTHTKLWLKMFGDSAYILNDDKPALRVENGEWFAYGTPWSGKNDISVSARVPVKGIAVLARGEENVIRRIAGKKAIFGLMEQTARPRNAEDRIKMMELLDQLLMSVPVWELHCNMSPEAALVSYSAMSEAGKAD
ncbi:MAG: hypothetical protein IJO53_03220 [Clostridia bacterium]|nr:hypothetical protein [Clostridia bacterium]MBQ9855181.1 hypothetical protein [Clostridia bacterium]